MVNININIIIFLYNLPVDNVVAFIRADKLFTVFMTVILIS